MNDMSRVIIAKSDQVNADDLISGPRTITITEVVIRPGTEQPVSMRFEGDENKPYKPCKSMCRVLVTLWGADAKQYTGRSMTLYRDPKVLWGGMAVGGIRISHMSHINQEMTLALTATKGSKKAFVVKPLATTQQTRPAATDKQREGVNTMLANLRACTSMTEANALVNGAAVIGWREKLGKARPDLEAEIAEECKVTFLRLMPPPTDEDDGFPGVVTPRADPAEVDRTVAGYGTDSRMAG